ncbi:23S rRNA (guanine(745)-N(1))-methyltransferase [Shewanella intestini]|uniref:23S rRNA (Guanine(745)-N(1))-methyltransferase n=1 Tax=Shewanella intestini TaxID=2017544 RepID=A0ABS5I306_9GAMM|nr:MULTISPECIES: 23S rRNA (guanine(745)-N(1))-methyltransferase [Shewanella]MBR9727780.1 23S rRNA (guanine(745)-N(1))-methyltransferase [Shewanella intestini]MRG36227.1 23S rRNA (guanine(745)-N(1))-methyltransferase [Shewanella sp. XMDDZSB0408]
MSYICPICSLPLTLSQTSWGCENRHQFDQAKEGYVNLLPVQKKKTKDPGDSKEMMMARRGFLSQGFYQQLSDRVNQLALTYIKPQMNVLDIGCGEGYYTHRLTDVISQQADINIYGIDISKAAVRYGAKRYPKINFSVASVFEMPFADNSFDMAIRIYAPSKPQELQRVMKDNGIIITVSPGPKHHYALKEIIYDKPKLHPEDKLLIEGFDYLHQENLCYQLQLTDKQDLENFLNMTPYAWKLSDFQKQRLIEKGLNCELDFKIEIHKREAQC